MTKLKCFTLFLYSALFSATVMADDNVNVRDGRPCLGGICVGDEISTLTGIKWQAASAYGNKIPKMGAADIKSLLKNFAPSAATAVTAAAPYLKYASFDGQAIPKLAKVKGFCGPLDSAYGLMGTFISDSGHLTRVFVNVVPEDDPLSQTLRVKHIERIFPAEYTSEQISELSKQLEERYRGVKKTHPWPSETEPTWEFVVGLDRKLALYAPLGNIGHIRDQLKEYPGCENL